MDSLVPVLAGLASGLAVQVVAVYLRASIERTDRDVVRREEQKEIIALIRYELNTLSARFEHLEHKVESVPCRGLHTGIGGGLNARICEET